ncbi:MAG: DNA-binding protein Alba [Methanobacteriota archaeon]|nr:MAG: DNA-binding protein Alba [Euryarchaeota archaeon]
MARSLDAVGPGLERLENNTVYIGKKPMMTYVLAVVSQFNVGSENVIIKARGKSISRAVDVAEIVRNRYVTQAQVREIRIGTERLPEEDGTSTNVSSIEIFLSK